MKETKSAQKRFTKEQIERMYKVAYYLDRSFFRPADSVDFKLDVYRLKECGEVHMKQSLVKLRLHAEAIQARMSDTAKAMYLWSYLCDGFDRMRLILSDMEPFVKSVALEKSLLENISVSMSGKLPAALQTKLKDFGKEWGA